MLGLEGLTVSGIQGHRPLGSDDHGALEFDGEHTAPFVKCAWKTILDKSKGAVGMWRVFDLVNPDHHIVYDIQRPQLGGDDDWAHAVISLHLKMSQARMTKQEFNIDLTIFNYNGTDYFLASATSEAAIRDQVIEKINAIKEGMIGIDNVKTFYCFDATSAMNIAMKTYEKLHDYRDVIYLTRLMRAIIIVIDHLGREDPHAGHLNGFIGDVVLSERCFERVFFPEACGNVRALCGECISGVKQAGEKVVDAIMKDFQTMAV